MVRDMIVDIKIREAFLAAEEGEDSDLFPLLLQKKLRCENVEGDIDEYLTRVLRIREVFRMCDLRQSTDMKFLATITRARRFCIRELAFMLSHLGMQAPGGSRGSDTSLPAARILGFLIAARRGSQHPPASAEGGQVTSSAGEEILSANDVEERVFGESFDIEQAAELMVAALYVLASIQGGRRIS